MILERIFFAPLGEGDPMAGQFGRGDPLLAALAALFLLTACATSEPSASLEELPATSAVAKEIEPEVSRDAASMEEPEREVPPGGEGGKAQVTEALPAFEAARKQEGRPTGSLFLEEAVRQALAWHPSLEVATGRLRQRIEEIEVARAGYYPQVGASVDSGFDREDRRAWQPRLSLTASQMLHDFGKVESSVEAQSAAAQASRARLLVDVDSLIRDTANAVVEVQRNEALRKLAQDQIVGVEAIAALVRKRSAKGASSRSDEVQADARLEAAEATLLEIEAQLSRWKSTLASLVGAKSELEVEAEVPEWLGRTCEIREPDWPRVPALAEAEALRNEALAQLERSRAELYPTVSLESSLGYDLHQQSLSERRRSRDQPEFFIGLRVSANLYDGGADLARSRAAAHALSSADASIRNIRFEVERGLFEAREQVASLEELLLSLSARDRMTQQTRDLYRQQYIELGTRSLLDLLNAEQELHQARFNSANTIHDLRQLAIQCLYSSGKAREAFGVEQFAPEDFRLAAPSET